MKPLALLLATLALGCGAAVAADKTTADKLVPLPVADRPACTAPEVATGAGSVCGLALEADAADGSGEHAVDAYLGIPYAEPPIGANRWQAPVPAAPHDGVLKATAFGPVCPQVEPSPKKVAQSEDCLSLNVWTPRTGTSGAEPALPVMVYIHGGSFVDSASSLPIFDGRFLAASERVVVVTINYRLGALGFLAGIDGLTGNYGFLDQQLALRWVQDNIARFGGDPEKVTLFGQSAGAMSVGLHLVAPGSRDLFRAAIMESNPYGIPFKTPDVAGRFAELFRLKLGCLFNSLACMRRQSAETIVKEQTSLMLALDTAVSGFAGDLVWGPVIDGKVIPAVPLATPIDKPVLLGTNLNDGLFFVSGERFKWFGKTEVPEIEYTALTDLYFPPEGREAIHDIARYQPRSGDDTEAMAHLLTDYLFTCPNRLALAQATAPAWGYEFTHVPSFDVWPAITICAPDQKKVCHTFELPFVFGHATTVTRPLTPPDDQFTPAGRTLSEQMASYWIRFAETLDPNHDGAPAWSGFTKDEPVRQILDETIGQKTDLDANCTMWDGVGYALPGILGRIADMF